MLQCTLAAKQVLCAASFTPVSSLDLGDMPMTQQTAKKPHTAAAQSAANKVASATANTVNKAGRTALSAVESTRNSAHKVAQFGSEAMQDFMKKSASEAQRAQEKVMEMSREGAEHIAKSADVMTKVMHEVVGLSRGNIDACIECGNVTTGLAKEVSQEVIDYCNQAFSDSVELSKEMLNCRTLNDVIELQNRVMKHTLDNFFNQSMKMSTLMFEYATEAMEPINERISEASEQISRAVAA
jgi:hypothetical protein